MILSDTANGNGAHSLVFAARLHRCGTTPLARLLDVAESADTAIKKGLPVLPVAPGWQAASVVAGGAAP